jgi:hypothetical protein
MIVKLTDKQFNHMLAGLRALQNSSDPAIWEIAEEDGDMSAAEIDQLCEDFNCGELTLEHDPRKIEEKWRERVKFQGFSGKKLVTNEIEFFAGVMTGWAEFGIELNPKWTISIMSGRRIAP